MEAGNKNRVPLTGTDCRTMPEGVDKAAARAKRKEAKKHNKGVKKDAPKQTETKPTNVAQPENKAKADIRMQVAAKEIRNNEAVIKNVQKADLKVQTDPVIKNVQKADLKVQTGPVVKVAANKGNDPVVKVTVATTKDNDTITKRGEQKPDGGPSKVELRAQRKAVQEAQRLAKAAANLAEKPATNAAKIEAGGAGKPVVNTNDTPISKQPEDSGTNESKAELRAKRRALQEAQRQKKSDAQASAKTKVLNEMNKPASKEPLKGKEPVKVSRISARKDSISVVTGGNFQKQVQLFNHLYLRHSTSMTKELTAVVGLHAAIIRLGAQYMSHSILGSNARCLALLAAIKQVIVDYRTPAHEEFCRSFESNLQSSTNYLQKCRPLAVSMTNAVRNIKLQLTQLPEELTDKMRKEKLLEAINTYINEDIGMADKAISLTVKAKITNRDVILTYGCSSIVAKILLDAHEGGRVFQVVVVDARPLLEGRELLRKLVNAGISCSYVLINATSFIMGRVTKVLLGAHSLLANGYVMSRAGTAQVALIAQSFNKPVLVCCETYKFCERVQTDSIVHNEIGDPDKLFATNTFEGQSPLANWKKSRCVTPLNLMYDVTPPHLVTAVVTELAILPCTSVPVILRIKPTELVF